MSDPDGKQETEGSQAPESDVPGAVPGLCSAGSTSLALCGAFLGYWGFQGQGDWQFIHLTALIPLFLAAAAFGLTPFVATRVGGVAKARRVYFAGLFLLLFAMTAALWITYTNPAERQDTSIHTHP
jgi:hypothetical protein